MIKFDIKNVDVQLLQRKKKRPFENMYEYDLETKTALFSRKRRDTPERMFNEMLEDIIDNSIKFDQTKIFHQPVKKKEYQDYYNIVKNPIDLSAMKNKTKRTEYTTVQQLTDDIELLVNNSILYNGEQHDVTMQAIRIRENCNQKIEE
jgi:transcription initiation factor TFIID subunit 1